MDRPSGRSQSNRVGSSDDTRCRHPGHSGFGLRVFASFAVKSLAQACAGPSAGHTPRWVFWGSRGQGIRDEPTKNKAIAVSASFRVPFLSATSASCCCLRGVPSEGPASRTTHREQIDDAGVRSARARGSGGSGGSGGLAPRARAVAVGQALLKGEHTRDGRGRRGCSHFNPTAERSVGHGLSNPSGPAVRSVPE